VAAEETGGTISLETAARLIEATPRRVQQLVKDGWIPRPVTRGRYSLVGVVQGTIRYHKSREKRNGETGTPDTYEASRTRYMKARAEIHEQEVQKRRGELIPRARVELVWSGILKLVRQGLLGLPARAAPLVHDLETIPEVREVLAEEVHQVLRDLAATEVDYQAESDREPGPEESDADLAAGVEAAAQAHG
jgi:phage terminase Nu1 subunit (DNA packaging protein)